MRVRSWLFLTAISAFSVPAHAIPPPPPPLDPAALTEAGKLADALLADLDESGLQYQARVAMSHEVRSWLEVVHPDVREPAVRDAFHAAAMARVDAVWPEQRASIGGAVANSFRFMSATDLIAARSFIESSAGQSFARTLAGPGFGLADRVAALVLYRRVFPEFPGLLAAAQKSAAE